MINLVFLNDSGKEGCDQTQPKEIIKFFINDQNIGDFIDHSPTGDDNNYQYSFTIPSFIPGTTNHLRLDHLLMGQDKYVVGANSVFLKGIICIANPAPTPSPTATVTPTLTPTPTPTAASPTATATPTSTPIPRCYSSCANNADCPTGTSCLTVNATKKCVNSACPSMTSCVCPLPTSTSTNAPTSTPTPTDTPTATPTSTPLPTATPTIQAACFGTCNSNSECQSGLVCLAKDGVNRCLNASCPSEDNCSCPNPTAVPTNTPVPTSTPTTPIYLAEQVTNTQCRFRQIPIPLSSLVSLASC